MTITQAIEKAIEGGFEPHISNWNEWDFERYAWQPSFWQALMIGLGKDVKNGTMRCKNYNPRYNEEGEGGCFSDKCEYAGYVYWKDEWHRFLDFLAEGRPAEDFFKELLEKNQEK